MDGAEGEPEVVDREEEIQEHAKEDEAEDKE
jgi:hypothetical protein